MRDEPRAVLRGSGEWPTCQAHVAVAGFTLDCVRRRWHRLDGTELHLTSPDSDGAQIEWHMDMALTELERKVMP